MDDLHGILIPGGMVVSFLLAVNGWFIRRLVVKIEKIDDMVAQTLPVHKNEIKNLSEKIVSLENEIRTLNHELKDFGTLRERVAVVESLTGRKKPRGETTR